MMVLLARVAVSDRSAPGTTYIHNLPGRQIDRYATMVSDRTPECRPDIDSYKPPSIIRRC
jgi:hypothetical protein